MSCLSTQSYIPLIYLFNIQGTGASTVGGGLRNTPETRSPTTPIHGDGGAGGLGGSAAASSDAWASAVLAVTTSAVLDVLALKPFSML